MRWLHTSDKLIFQLVIWNVLLSVKMCIATCTEAAQALRYNNRITSLKFYVFPQISGSFQGYLEFSNCLENFKILRKFRNI